MFTTDKIFEVMAFQKKPVNLDYIEGEAETSSKIKTPRILFLSLNHISLGAMRCFRNMDCKLIGFSRKKSFVSFSKHLSKQYAMSIETEPDSVLGALIDLGKNETDKGFIIPTSENELRFLNSNRDSLAAYYYLSMPNMRVIDIVFDKYKFYLEMEQNGFNSPVTIQIGSEKDLFEKKDGLFFPCIVKPAFSGDWKTKGSVAMLQYQKAIKVNDFKALLACYRTVKKVSPNVILQEIIESEETDTFSFCSFADRKGKLMFGFVTQKIIQYPQVFGTALLCGTIRNPAVYTLGKKVVETLGIDGICEVEIIRNRHDGSLSVIEVNTRHWKQAVMSDALGVNFTLMDYYCRTGYRHKAEELVKFRGKHLIWFDDLGFLVHCVKNFFHPGKCKFQFMTGKKFVCSTFSTKDPLPFIFDFLQTFFFSRIIH